MSDLILEMEIRLLPRELGAPRLCWGKSTLSSFPPLLPHSPLPFPGYWYKSLSQTRQCTCQIHDSSTRFSTGRRDVSKLQGMRIHALTQVRSLRTVGQKPISWTARTGAAISSALASCHKGSLKKVFVFGRLPLENNADILRRTLLKYTSRMIIELGDFSGHAFLLDLCKTIEKDVIAIFCRRSTRSGNAHAMTRLVGSSKTETPQHP